MHKKIKMQKPISVVYERDNDDELQQALDTYHNGDYVLINAPAIDMIPSLMCKKDGVMVGAMFLTEPKYEVTVYETHVVFNPAAMYQDYTKL
jgi:hypothetical protein